MEYRKISELETGMQIIQRRAAGEYGILGAGTVIVKDIPKRCVAVESPAGSY